MVPRQQFKSRAFFKGNAHFNVTASVTTARKVFTKRNAGHHKKHACDPAMILFGLNQQHFNVDYASKVLIRDACIMQMKDVQRQKHARQELKSQQLEYMGQAFMAEAVRSQASEAEESLKAAWAAEEDEQQLAWEAANTAYLNEAIQDEVWDGTEWYGIRADGVIIAQHQEDDSTDELEGLFGGLSAGDKDMMDA